MPTASGANYSCRPPGGESGHFDALSIEKGALLPIVSPGITPGQADILDALSNPRRFSPSATSTPGLTNSPDAPLGDLH